MPVSTLAEKKCFITGAASGIGRAAAQRAVSRLDPSPVATGSYRVLFSAEVARSLIGHLLGAVSGGALYRGASFLVDSAGQQLFPDWFAIHERPFLERGLRSAAFDAEGVAWEHVPDLGRTHSAVTPTPPDAPAQAPGGED